MARSNVLLEKSEAFAIRCVNLHQYLVKEKKEYILSKQLLRSGTSVGANVTEAQYAQTKADFAAKLSIARKEAGESRYWINLLGNTNFLNRREQESILNDCNELLRLLQTITKTLYNK